MELLSAFLIVQVLGSVGGYPSGAPTGACEDMLPRHTGVTPQSSPAPYRLLTNARTFQPGKAITGTVSTTASAPLLEGQILFWKRSYLKKTNQFLCLLSFIQDSGSCPLLCICFQSESVLLLLAGIIIVHCAALQWWSLDLSIGAFCWRLGQPATPALWGAGASLHPILNSFRWGQNSRRYIWKIGSDSWGNRCTFCWWWFFFFGYEFVDSAQGTHKGPSPIPTPT